MLGHATPCARRSSQPREGADNGERRSHVEDLPVEVEVMEGVVERLRSQRKNAEGQRSRPHQCVLRIFNIHVITHRLNRHRDQLVRTGGFLSNSCPYIGFDSLTWGLLSQRKRR